MSLVKLIIILSISLTALSGWTGPSVTGGFTADLYTVVDCANPSKDTSFTIQARGATKAILSLLTLPNGESIQMDCDHQLETIWNCSQTGAQADLALQIQLDTSLSEDAKIQVIQGFDVETNRILTDLKCKISE